MAVYDTTASDLFPFLLIITLVCLFNQPDGKLCAHDIKLRDSNLYSFEYISRGTTFNPFIIVSIKMPF